MSLTGCVSAHGEDRPAEALPGATRGRSSRAPVLVVRRLPGVDYRTHFLVIDVTGSSREAARCGIAPAPRPEHCAVHVCTGSGEARR
jgi:hypothetical protein